jgi:hypothetical protein
VPAENSESSEKVGDFGLHSVMSPACSHWFRRSRLGWPCRFRSRAELELELIALRHQVAVLNRQRRSRLRLYSVDRMLLGLALPSVAALPPDHGTGEAGNRGPMASPGLSALLALAVSAQADKP